MIAELDGDFRDFIDIHLAADEQPPLPQRQQQRRRHRHRGEERRHKGERRYGYQAGRSTDDAVIE